MMPWIRQGYITGILMQGLDFDQGLTISPGNHFTANNVQSKW